MKFDGDDHREFHTASSCLRACRVTPGSCSQIGAICISARVQLNKLQIARCATFFSVGDFGNPTWLCPRSQQGPARPLSSMPVFLYTIIGGTKAIKVRDQPIRRSRELSCGRAAVTCGWDGDLAVRERASVLGKHRKPSRSVAPAYPHSEGRGYVRPHIAGQSVSSWSDPLERPLGEWTNRPRRGRICNGPCRI